MKKAFTLYILLFILTACAPEIQDKNFKRAPLQEQEIVQPNIPLPREEPPLKQQTSTLPSNVLAGTTSKYVEFNQAAYQQALDENKIILLYFYANWCPLCTKEQPEIFSAFNELNNPEVVGFRVNFRDSDTDQDEVELAKKYGISYQHTKVILKNGERILKSPESWNKERYLQELQSL